MPFIDISLYVTYNTPVRSLRKKPIQIYLEPKQDSVLELLSKKRGISKAAIIRESLERYLGELPLVKDPAMGIIGLGSSGKGDLSVMHDRYLAGHASKGKR